MPLYEVPWPIGSADERFRFPTRSSRSPRRVRVRRTRPRARRARRASCGATRERRAHCRRCVVTGEAGAGKSRLVTEFARAIDGRRPHGPATAAATRSPAIRSSPSPSGCVTSSRTRRPPSVGMVRARHGAQLSRLVPELRRARTPRPTRRSSRPTAAIRSALVRSGGRLADTRAGRRTDPARARRPAMGVPSDARNRCSTSLPRRRAFPAMLARDLSRRRRPGASISRALLGRFDVGRPRATGRARRSRARRRRRDGRRVAPRAHDRRSARRRSPTRSTRSRAAIRCSSRRSRAQLESDDLRTCGASHQPVRPPARVMELVVNRLAGLDPATVELLQKAAVAGHRVRVLAAAHRSRPNADDADDRLLDRLAEAVDARYLVELPGTPLRYRFAHGVVRNALLETVPVSQRMRLHRLGRPRARTARARRPTIAPSRRSRTTSREAAPLGEVGPCDQLLPARRRRRDPTARARRSRRVVREGPRRRRRGRRLRRRTLRAAARTRSGAGVRGPQASTRRACSMRTASPAAAVTRRALPKRCCRSTAGSSPAPARPTTKRSQALEATLELFDERDDGGTKAVAAGGARVRARLGGGRRPPVRR